jgi:hypothetical protein
LLTTVSYRENGAAAPQADAEAEKKVITTFRTAFDHMLFTVKPTPMEKSFINNNAEGVWIKP